MPRSIVSFSKIWLTVLPARGLAQGQGVPGRSSGAFWGTGVAGLTSPSLRVFTRWYQLQAKLVRLQHCTLRPVFLLGWSQLGFACCWAFSHLMESAHSLITSAACTAWAEILSAERVRAAPAECFWTSLPIQMHERLFLVALPVNRGALQDSFAPFLNCIPKCEVQQEVCHRSGWLRAFYCLGSLPIDSASVQNLTNVVEQLTLLGPGHESMWVRICTMSAVRHTLLHPWGSMYHGLVFTYRRVWACAHTVDVE